MKELIHSNPELLITVVGIGGCGCNTINMLYENGFSEQVNLIAVNTDLAALNNLQKAAEESADLLTNAIKKSDIVIITAGLGGGTGTGASPLVARIARELNINCLAIVTLPFESEGKMRMDFALQGIKDIKAPIHAYITLSNDLLLQGLGKSIGLFAAFNQSNEVLKNLLVSLVQMLTETGYVNVDKNDFSSILSYEGESILGVGKADTEELAFEALDQALNNPLVSIANIDTAKGIIFQLFCKSEPKLSTFNGLIAHIREKITNKSVLIVPGVTLDPSLSCEIEILIVASGISQLPSEPDDTNSNTLVDNSSTNHNLDYNQIASDVDEVQSYTDIPAITRKLRETKPVGENNV